jgi:hypothetical protein
MEFAGNEETKTLPSAPDPDHNNLDRSTARKAVSLHRRIPDQAAPSAARASILRVWKPRESNFK